MPDKTPSFLFGGKEFPLATLNKHVFFLGATGSGKSVSIRLLLQLFLKEIGKHLLEGGYRALIYDAKLDVMTQLWELEEDLHCPIKLTNPFDKRSSAWDISKDITSPAAAFEMASIIAPVSEAAAQPFWDRAMVNILSGVLIALHLRAPGQWDLRIVCLVMRSQHHLIELLSQSSVTRHLVRHYFQEAKVAASIMATIDSKMQPYSVIASLWSKSKSKFSLREFRDSESILVLGSNEEAREQINLINLVLMRRLTELLLAQADSATRRTLICLDEVREAGKLELSSLALRGRSKGVSLVAGAQDVDGLSHIYGEQLAYEFLGQFGYKAVLKLDSPQSARFASSLFGATEVKESNAQSSRSFGSGEMQMSQGTSQVLRDRDVILPNEIMTQPVTSAKSGMAGIYKTPYGSFKSQFDFVSLLHRRENRPPLPADYNFQERPETDQYLEDWSAAELAHYGLTPIPPDEGPPRPRERNRSARDLNSRGNPRGNRNQKKAQDVSEEEDDPDEDEDEDI